MRLPENGHSEVTSSLFLSWLEELILPHALRRRIFWFGKWGYFLRRWCNLRSADTSHCSSTGNDEEIFQKVFSSDSFGNFLIVIGMKLCSTNESRITGVSESIFLSRPQILQLTGCDLSDFQLGIERGTRKLRDILI
jgi:hypothetical protein